MHMIKLDPGLSGSSFSFQPEHTCTVGGSLTKYLWVLGTRLCQIFYSYLHQCTEHVNCSMCHSIVISFQCFNNLHTKLISEPDV